LRSWLRASGWRGLSRCRCSRLVLIGFDQPRAPLLDQRVDVCIGGLGGRPVAERRNPRLRCGSGRGGAVALGTIRQILSDLVRNELAATVDKKSADVLPREFAVQYVVGAFMAVMTWWLDGGAKLPPRRIDAMFRRLATEGIMPSYS